MIDKIETSQEKSKENFDRSMKPQKHPKEHYLFGRFSLFSDVIARLVHMFQRNISHRSAMIWQSLGEAQQARV